MKKAEVKRILDTDPILVLYLKRHKLYKDVVDYHVRLIKRAQDNDCEKIFKRIINAKDIFLFLLSCRTTLFALFFREKLNKALDEIVFANFMAEYYINKQVEFKKILTKCKKCKEFKQLLVEAIIRNKAWNIQKTDLHKWLSTERELPILYQILPDLMKNKKVYTLIINLCPTLSPTK